MAGSAGKPKSVLWGAGSLAASLARHLRVEDPERVYLKSAARAAIVMPAVFAFADNVIQQPQTTIFSAFGSFAVLVLADFSGPRRARLVAYLALAGAGAVLIFLGTLCSQSTLLGTAAMAVVGFMILFSGVINGYLAAAGFAALLTFIISVNVPAPVSAVPTRLEGWALACGVGISAVMLLWPRRSRADLRADAARACAALADLLESELDGDRRLVAARASAAREAVAALRRRFVATPYRPSGATGSTEALAFLVDELDWLQSLILPATIEAERPPALCQTENREAMAASIAALRASAARLNGLDERPDLDRLERAREAVTEAMVREVGELPTAPKEAALLSALEPSFEMRELSNATGQVGANALLATGSEAPDLERVRSIGASASRAVGKLALEHTRPRSVWFRNSVRGAAALSIAVFVAQQASLQHSFWVVLGTLSVLRSNALGTGSTILSALAGTAIGIIVGVGIILLIGTADPVLWVVLPFAVMFAAYAPRAISFAAGQAGFTVVVVVLFDIIQPTGWTVGLVRVEDVAVGCAISLGVGLLFWPRGARALLRDSLAEAFARGADYVAATVHALARGDPGSGAVQPARGAARAAAHRLDDAFRQFLAERGAERVDLDSVGTLVAGATRVRLAGYSLLTIARGNDRQQRGERCAGALDREVDALRSWYVALGDALARSAAAPPPHRADAEGRRRVLQCMREAVADGEQAGIRAALGMLLASQHLDNLHRLESRLAKPAAELSGDSAESPAVPRHRARPKLHPRGESWIHSRLRGRG